MQKIDKLKHITAILLNEEIHYSVLYDAMQEYKNLLLELSDIDLEDAANRKNLEFDNGIAIGLTWAAKCLEDLMRTRKFVRGTFKAIIKLLAGKKRPVKILYAGTGPFATLMLPIFSTFKSDAVQVLLMDINERCIEGTRKIVQKLGFEDFVIDYVCADATDYKVEHEFDILLTETMQSGLFNEHQVPICFNLIPQLSEEVLLIPQKIKLDLAYLDSKILYEGMTLADRNIWKFETILEFDQAYIRSYLKESGDAQPGAFLLEKTIPLPKPDTEKYSKFELMTEIQIYEDEWLHFNQSGLTTNRHITNLGGKEEHLQSINLKYQLKPKPIFEFDWNPATTYA